MWLFNINVNCEEINNKVCIVVSNIKCYILFVFQQSENSNVRALLIVSITFSSESVTNLFFFDR